MNILFFDANKRRPDEICRIVNYVKDKLNEDMIALPKDFNLITDCSLDQLKSVQALIDKAIKEKEEK